MRPTMSLSLFAVAAAIALPAAAFDAAAVQKEVDAMNQSLPTMVSPVLREEPIRFTGTALMYTFTHVGQTPEEVARKNLNVTARAYLLRQLCTDADTRQMMRDGLLFTFTYQTDATATSHADGAVISEGDCTRFDVRR